MAHKRYLTATLFCILLIAISVAGRLAPHYPNFTPIAATALFAAFFLRGGWATLVPISAMLISDAFIGFYDWRIMLVVYGSLAFPVLLGPFLRGRLSPIRLTACVAASSTMFFLATNFAVWMFGSMYLRSLGGLLECYVAALPFFKYTLLGDFFWSSSLFATYALVRYLARLRIGAALLEWKPVSAHSLHP